MIKKIILVIVLILLTAGSIPAYELVKDEGVRNEEGIFDDDYLFLGNSLEMSGSIEDLFFLGRALYFSGKAKLGIFALGQEIDLSGNAGNGFFGAGESLRISGDIEGVCFIGGKNVIIEKDAVIKGPVFILADRIIIRGTITGDVFVCSAWLDIDEKIDGSLRALTGNLVIDNVINGNVDAVTGRFDITDRGFINGNLSYASQKAPSENALKRVKGLVQLKPDVKEFKSYKGSSWIGKFFILSLILTGLLILLIPGTKALGERSKGDSFWHRILWGIIPFLIYPSAILLFLILLITSPFALILILAGFPVLYLTMVFGSVLLGRYITGIFKWQINQRHILYLIGAFLFFALSFIPYIKIILIIIISSLGWSYLLSCIFRDKFQFGNG